MTPSFQLKPREYLDDPERKRLLNRELFTTIAPHYDTINRWLSLGRDQKWKDRLIGLLPEMEAPECLDLACGTGDLTRRLARRYPRGRILGLDLTPRMIDLTEAQGPDARIRYQVGDMGRTGLADASFDFVTGGYALRNAGDLDEALLEIHRVLKPGGYAAFLDFSKSPNRMAQRITLGILRIWGGLWGLMLHRNPAVYTYIADSLKCYPDRRALTARFQAAGLAIESRRLFFFGIIETVLLRKPEQTP